MNLFGLNKRRSETLLLAIGQLILIAYVFQVAAFDHWVASAPTDFASLGVTGIEGTSTHASTSSSVHADHCHGGPSSCADGGGGFAQLAVHQVVRLPSSVPSLVVALPSTSTGPSDPFIGLRPEPPRAAA